MIKCAAILCPNGKVYTGARHLDIIKNAYEALDDICSSESIEGFVTEDNKFLNREDAGKHAFECGQINSLTSYLVSTDLY